MRFANTTLSDFNTESERAYESISSALKKHAGVIKSVQTDLMAVFKRIRTLRAVVRDATGLIGDDTADEESDDPEADAADAGADSPPPPAAGRSAAAASTAAAPPPTDDGDD